MKAMHAKLSTELDFRNPVVKGRNTNSGCGIQNNFGRTRINAYIARFKPQCVNKPQKIMNLTYKQHLSFKKYQLCSPKKYRQTPERPQQQ